MTSDYDGYFESRRWADTTSEENFWYYDSLSRMAGVETAESVLEIGFGDGRFLDWASTRGLNVTGVEIMPLAIEKARSRGHRVLQGPFTSTSLPAQLTVDLIAAFDVLEHLTIAEMRRLFADTVTHLSPKGKYLLRFPNGSSPFVGPIQAGDVTHKTLVSAAMIEDLCNPLGLQIDAFFNDRIAPPGIFKSAKRGIVFAVRNLIECVIGYVYYGKRIPLDVNLFVVLTRVPSPQRVT